MRFQWPALVTLAVTAAVTGSGFDASPAGALAIERGAGSARSTGVPGLPADTPAAANAAPSGPPLASAGTGAGTGTAAGGEEGAGEIPQAEADPLVSNGLGSPTCTGALAGELSQASRRNCETSGFVAAPAPTADYGIDVHIDAGVLGISAGGALVQELIVTPLWMALVWAVHALVVMLEWSFTIDLLDGPAASGVGAGLSRCRRRSPSRGCRSRSLRHRCSRSTTG